MPKKQKKNDTGQTIALTGATGFLGGHVIEALLSAGHTVKALTRRCQPEREGVLWVEGSLTDEESLLALNNGANTLIHLAGLTKALNRNTFFDVNVAGSLRLFHAAKATGVKHVLHISSLAAREPRLSHYGASKAGTELLLTERKWNFSWTILRPPAIYGPGDKEILKLIKATRFGIIPAIGSKKNRFAMIHAADLASAILALCDQSNKSAILEVDDGTTRGYTIEDVANAMPDSKTLHQIPVPFPVLAAIGSINQLIANAINRPAMLTLSTARYLCHPDWTVKQPRRFRHEKWLPQFDLKAGLKNTIDWYRQNGLL